jgi:hypothetical protein
MHTKLSYLLKVIPEVHDAHLNLVCIMHFWNNLQQVTQFSVHHALL